MSYKIRILFVVNSLKRRGAEEQLFKFIQALPTYIEIHLFKFSHAFGEFPEFENLSRATIHSCTQGGTYSCSRFLSLYRIVADGKYDVLVTVGLGAALFIGRLCAVKARIPIVYSFLNTIDNFNKGLQLPGNYFDVFNSCLNWILVAFRKNRVFRFLGNSNSLCAVAKKSLPSRYSISTMYNGIDGIEIDDIGQYRPSAKGICILDSIRQRPTVIQVGAIDNNKNQRFTIECMDGLIREVPNVLLVIAGDGGQRRLTEVAKRYNVCDRVLFTGQLAKSDCLFLVRSSRVLVSTSLSESFPNVVTEAQALSVPVVAFNVGGTSEIVQDGHTGYVVECGDRLKFTHSLKRLLTNCNLARDMGQRGRERILRLFSMRKKVDEFMSLINRDCDFIYKDIHRESSRDQRIHP